MSDDDNTKKPPSPKLLNAKARGQALILLGRKHRSEYKLLYNECKREVYRKAGVPLSRRHIRHRDDGTGFCVACGEEFPCPPAVRRMNRNTGSSEDGEQA